MEKLSSLLKKPLVRVGIGLVLLIGIGGAGGGFADDANPPEQPIQFPHSFHVGVGAPCQYCHSGVTTGHSAGLPSASISAGAATNNSTKRPRLRTVAQIGEICTDENQPIPWVPVAIQPDFVHFNHRPHIAAGVACETCHGNISAMTVAQPPFVQNMGWCLDCHKKMRPLDFVRLGDCTTCHY